ncbi:MAG: DUF1549 domain-containing protein [Verrucomicrobiota bacterium]
MNFKLTKCILVFLWYGCSAALAKLSPEQAATLPPPADHKINFSQEVKPILEASCVKCHGRGKAKGDFQIDNRETFLKGGESGAAVVLGKSAESRLVELVAGLDPDSIMPKKGSKLTPAQIGLLRAWIDQGAAWGEGVSFGKPPSVNLLPSRPQIPPARKGISNPIDRILLPYFEAHQFNAPPVVEERVFVRRVFLDVIGLLPTPEEVKRFQADRRSDKRERLVQRLLADNQAYAQHWLTFWNDALRNDYVGTGFIDGGRKQITAWLYSALARNLPYDKFVAQLVNPVPGSEGFSKGIIWRGVVNASQTPQLQAAQNISQIFMGVNLKCASCHDSFINDWALADAYGLANIYADEPLQMYLCDKPIGKKAATKFLYPELGDIDGSLDKTNRLRRLAEVICSRQDGRLTRTIVNRLWARLMGYGLVEPLDDMEQPAWNPDLLSWLAEDFADHGYDLKRTMALIFNSRAYQLPAVSQDEQRKKDFVFNGPAIRRMTSEQFRDALGSLTSVWYEKPDGEFDFLAGRDQKNSSMLARNLKPKWIWKNPKALDSAPTETVYWRKTVLLREKASEAHVVCTADDNFTLYVNGNKAGSGNDWEKPKFFDLNPYLLKGENVIAIESANGGDKPNPAGLMLYARVRHFRSPAQKSGEMIMDFTSDGTWLWTVEKKDGWEKPGFADEAWTKAVVLDDSKLENRQLESRFSAILSMPTQYGRIRAALVKADPLAIALGRPNREQVITLRASAATTLQGLELTNGGSLAGLLSRGAEKLAATDATNSRALVEKLYERAFGRQPSIEEASVAKGLVGAPVKKEGVEDLLWGMAMLPEFQLIY